MKQYLTAWLVYPFLATLIIPSIVYASDDGAQLDRIESKVETVVISQEKILEVVDADPLKGKQYGIEINPFRLLFIDKDNKTFSGSFSFFNVRPNVEISIPVYASINGDSLGNGNDLSVYTLDGHYRYFLGKRAQGFYISGFSRFAALNGTLASGNYYNSQDNKKGTTYKLGAGFGIGYRVFSKNGFYWGASISLGRYFIGKSNQYRSSEDWLSGDIDDQEVIFDVEFFKMGYAF